MSGEAEPDTICVAADGLELEIAIAPGALTLRADLAAVVTSAIAAANRATGPTRGEVTVVVDDDARIQSLNRQWRGFDKPTNVLSFPAPDHQAGDPPYLGDIAISYETAAREAADEGKSFAAHVAHLSVHGFLHLMGFDHESDGDAAEMEGLERDILAQIGISDPYIAPAADG